MGEQERYADALHMHLTGLTRQLRQELADLFSQPLQSQVHRLLFELTFDTMGAPITVYAFDHTGNPLRWFETTETRTLLHPHRLYPESLSDEEEFWSDDAFRQTLHFIADWFYQVWLSETKAKFNGAAYLLSYSYDAPEQFNLQTGDWEPLP
ncbi:hypothetical protein E7T09_11965 [Deinococcus sp. KSM4-11]|uniref:hypothetical protein n=1 Tax=Deinococcus sp. KSM4-11 TaxID=2568654 RepID=UPI0010A351CC|nr:hypothetical protein [Deinococcus sp. KSM4-11]THF86793.1 hypothetical protein E7T09_11965 [Deinococcus sp. KSM4-11]